MCRVTPCSGTCLTQFEELQSCTDVISYTDISKIMGYWFSCLSFDSETKIKSWSFTDSLVCKFSILQAEAVSTDSQPRHPYCLRRPSVILVAHPKQRRLAQFLEQFSDVQRLAGAAYSRCHISIPHCCPLCTFRQCWGWADLWGRWGVCTAWEHSSALSWWPGTTPANTTNHGSNNYSLLMPFWCLQTEWIWSMSFLALK